MAEFAMEKLGAGCVDEAWRDFQLDELADERARDEEPGLISSWFLYSWVRDWCGSRNTIAGAFLESQGQEIPESARDFILLISGAPYSFFEVRGVTPGRRLVLHDVFLEVEHDIIERSASHLLQEGDIVFARVIALSGFSLMLGCGALALSMRDMGALRACRKQLQALFGGKLSTFTLLGSADVLRSLYLERRNRRRAAQ